MFMWDLLVDALRAVLVVLTHAFGGSLGTAIAAVSIAARLLLLPLTLRVALEGRVRQRRLAELEPELARLRARHASDPGELATRTLALHRKHGIGPVPRGTIQLMLVQLPLGAALYRAIATGLGAAHRFLWVADLARPDAGVAAAAALITAGAAAAAGSAATTAPNGGAPGLWAGIVASALVTLLFVWRVSSGVGIYVAAQGLVGVAQSLLVRRAESRAGARVATT